MYEQMREINGKRRDETSFFQRARTMSIMNPNTPFMSQIEEVDIVFNAAAQAAINMTVHANYFDD